MGYAPEAVFLLGHSHVRSSVAIRGEADTSRTTHFGSD